MPGFPVQSRPARRRRRGRGDGWRRWRRYRVPSWYSVPAHPEVVCATIYAPVLATDGNIYGNECLAHRAGFDVVKRVSLDMAGLGEFDFQKVIGPANWIAILAMIYHGYKRNDSVLWGLAWGLTGFLGVPFALAQGFGKRKR